MKIKHYRAADMRQALRQVREAQGPDAVILSSRRIANGVEVVAAVDYDVEIEASVAANEPARPEARIPTAADYAALTAGLTTVPGSGGTPGTVVLHGRMAFPVFTVNANGTAPVVAAMSATPAGLV